MRYDIEETFPGACLVVGVAVVAATLAIWELGKWLLSHLTLLWR